MATTMPTTVPDDSTQPTRVSTDIEVSAAIVAPTVDGAEQPDVATSTKRGLSRQSLIKLVLLIALVTGLIVALTVGDLASRIGDLFEWVDDNPVPGAFIFVGVYFVVTTVFFPSSILTLAGGAIFGFGGIALVWIGAVLGQTGSFFVSRYLLRDWVAKWGEKYPVWGAVDAAIRDQALKIVILLRLATIVPYSATNALLPVTSLSFFNYTVGSAIGIIPGVVLFTLIGTLATSVADVVSGNVDTDPTVLIASIVVSIVLMFVVVVLLTRYAKKALAEQTAAADAAAAEAAAQEAAAAAPPEGEDEAELPEEAVVTVGEDGPDEEGQELGKVALAEAPTERQSVESLQISQP